MAGSVFPAVTVCLMWRRARNTWCLRTAHSPHSIPTPRRGRYSFTPGNANGIPQLEDTPEMLRRSPQMIVRGYSADERIVHGTGAVVATERIAETVAALLARDDVAFVHVRSASNNCFQCRIDRGEVC